MSVMAYWSVVKMRLADEIPLHLRFIFNKMVQNDIVNLIVKEVVGTGESEKMGDFLEESPKIVTMRRKLLKSIGIFSESKSTLSKIIVLSQLDTASKSIDTASTVEDQPSEDPHASRYTWTINNFSSINVNKYYSDIFTIGGFKWRLLIFPKGNKVDHLSVYLDVADAVTLPYGWSRRTQLSLTVVKTSKYSIKKDTIHQFNSRDGGFTSFAPLKEIFDLSKGYLVNDTPIVEANVVVQKVE